MPETIQMNRWSADFAVWFLSISLVALAAPAQAAFVHPGCLSTQADLDRMATKVAANAQPWKGSWDILVGNEWYYMAGPETVPIVYCDDPTYGANFMTLARDSHRAYQCALRYHGTGNTNYAEHAVQIMNAWASTHTNTYGNSNVSLRLGLYGYAFACAGELMRDYSGWNPTDFAAFQQYMYDKYYLHNSWFLNNYYGRCDSHYWANWTLANMLSMLSIGVLCDDQTVFDEALNHFYNGIHTGSIDNMVVFRHPNGLGQWQESGRDQGHALIGPQLIGAFCEIAWNQGIDLYGDQDNTVLAGVEYISKYNTWNDVPYVTYMTCDYAVWPEPYRFAQTVIASGGRGQVRPGWDMIYNHYVNRMGIAAPWTKAYSNMVGPEGGGGNYGWNSGGFDGLGFTTLTHSRDPIASGAVPGTLIPYIEGRQITLSWAGSAYAESYNVKRSTTNGGPYTTIGMVASNHLSYVDSGLTAGTTYYYVVSANNPGGESADSAQVAATADGQLHGTIIGSEGSYGGFLADKTAVFDGQLRNFFDGPNPSISWAGLDLGEGVSAVITGVRWAPRRYFEGSTVGGKFQASSTPDFSSDVVDLYTIPSAQPAEALAEQSVSSGSGYRYVRYIGPSGVYCTISEVQFLGNISGRSAPSSPSGVSTSMRSGYNIDITWNAVVGATGYKVKRATSPGGPYIILGDVEGSSYADADLPGETSFYYTVSAYNSAGESMDSSAVSAATQSSGPHLLAYLKMDGNADDSSVNGYHAAEIGSPVYATGYGGQAVDCDAADDYVRLPAGVADSDDITIAAWVNWDGGGDWQRIFDFGTGTDRYLFLTPSSGAGNTLRFAIKNGGAEQIVETSTLASGTWVHVAVTLNGNTGTLYVNGSPAASNPSVTINPSDFNPWANYIGKSQYADPLFDGRIDEFRIYNYALSTAEVSALASAPPPPDTTPPAVPAGLVAVAGDGYVNLDWLDNDEIDLDSYTIYRSTTSGSGYASIASGLVSSNYLDSSAVNGITYYYVIAATDTSSNESGSSAEVSAMPLVPVSLSNGDFEQCTQENYPTGFDSPYDVPGWTDISIVDAGVENVAWWETYDNYSAFMKAGDGAYHMSDYIIKDGDEFVVGFVGKSWDGSSEWTVTLFYDSPANVIGTYVQAVDGVWAPFNRITPVPATAGSVGGTLGISFVNTGSGFANLDNVTLKAYPAIEVPSAPTGLSADSGDAQVALSWNAVSNATSYNVKRSLSSGSGYTVIASPSGTSQLASGLTNGTVYYFVVSALGAGGESDDSVEVSAVPSVAVSSNEYVISSHAVVGGTNLSLTVSNSVPGHDYGILATDTLTPPVWSNILVEAGDGSTLLFAIPISVVGSNRFFKLDVWQQ